jgi:hypothetical protein
MKPRASHALPLCDYTPALIRCFLNKPNIHDIISGKLEILKMEFLR